MQSSRSLGNHGYESYEPCGFLAALTSHKLSSRGTAARSTERVVSSDLTARDSRVTWALGGGENYSAKPVILVLQSCQPLARREWKITGATMLKTAQRFTVGHIDRLRLVSKKVKTLHQLQEQADTNFSDEYDELEDLLPNVEHPSLVNCSLLEELVGLSEELTRNISSHEMKGSDEALAAVSEYVRLSLAEDWRYVRLSLAEDWRYVRLSLAEDWRYVRLSLAEDWRYVRLSLAEDCRYVRLSLAEDWRYVRLSLAEDMKTCKLLSLSLVLRGNWFGLVEVQLPGDLDFHVSISRVQWIGVGKGDGGENIGGYWGGQSVKLVTLRAEGGNRSRWGSDGW
uniref:Uncharacterized protein n=1 Tax=Timema monikensis TaxID=170555 RepID=A0A7R9HRL0_9NEOP|nr:unnamed protein product [Timema monikensis]